MRVSCGSLLFLLPLFCFAQSSLTSLFQCIETFQLQDNYLFFAISVVESTTKILAIAPRGRSFLERHNADSEIEQCIIANANDLSVCLAGGISVFIEHEVYEQVEQIEFAHILSTLRDEDLRKDFRAFTSTAMATGLLSTSSSSMSSLTTGAFFMLSLMGINDKINP